MLKFFRLPFATTGDKTAVPDAVDSNGNVSYSQGYGFDYQRQKTDPAAKNIERDKMNQIFFDVTNAIAELQGQGVPDFITPELNGGSPFLYEKYAVVRYLGKNYVSIAEGNTANPTDLTAWKEMPTVFVRNAISRTFQEKGGDVVSVRDYITSTIDGVTDNQTGLVAAVADAYANGYVLDWPAGTYVSSANIPHLHDVLHVGPGAIKRGSDLYYWDVQSPDAVNVVYCSATGSDTNDGLSASQPLSVLAVQNYLEKLGPRTMRGRWRVQFAAGTYTRGLASSKLPKFTRYLELRGANRSVQNWAATTAVIFGELRFCQSGNLLYRCIASGTTGSVEPSGHAQSVTDGSVIWGYVAGWIPWITGRATNLGDYCKNAGKVYVAKSAGTTGATAPTHSTGAISDGGVSWAYIGLEIPLPTLEGTTIFDGSLNPSAWGVGQAVQIGDARYNGSHCYRARTAATTGASAPTHVSGTASDGAVVWEYIGERDTGVPYIAFDLNPCPRVNFTYLKFHNFQNADDTAAGAALDGPTTHLFQYVVAANCNMGAYHHGGSTICHQNTIYDSCANGIFAIYHVGATIGGPNISQPAFFRNCTNGVYLSRESVAHIDYAVIDGSSNDGVFVSIMSRFRSVGSHFLRNRTAVYCIGSSEWGDTPGTDCAFYLQTNDRNTYKQLLEAFSRFSDGSSYEHQYGGGELRYDANWNPVTSTATGGDAGTDVIVRELKRLPNAWALDQTKKVRIVVRGSFSGTAGIKNIKAALGTANLGSVGDMVATITGPFVFEVNAVPTDINTWSSSVSFENGTLRSLANYTGLTGFVLDANGVDYKNPIRVYRRLEASGDAITISSVEVFITG